MTAHRDTVFGDYDQAALDAQYNNRARVPDAPAYLERWAAESAAARQSCAGILDVAYGDHPRQRLDIFNAAGREAPTLVFIHGGYWHMLDKSGSSFPAPALTAAGINYVTVGYPLAPEVALAAIIASVRKAMAWLWRNAAAHGLDGERLYVSGHSAGGHLTAMTMASDWAGLDAGPGVTLPDDLAKGGCAISGLYELEPIRLSYLNEQLAIASDDLDRISPDRNLAPRRLHLAVGGEESGEFLRQTADFHRTWHAGGGSGEALVIAGKNHFSIVDGLADPQSELFRLIVKMVGAD